MFQRLLIMVLLASTAFGPQWCCCRMRGALAELEQAVSGRADAPRSSCCERGESRGHGLPAPENEGCPCKNRTRDLTSSGSTTSVVQDLLRTADANGCFAAVVTSPSFDELAAPVFSPRAAADFGLVLSGRDVLRLKQTLRC